MSKGDIFYAILYQAFADARAFGCAIGYVGFGLVPWAFMWWLLQ